jgi:uncharacterized membrane protein YfcA
VTALVLSLSAGGVIGLSLGALGGGGSVLAVPALIYLLGFTPVAATTAGLVIVAVTSATALVAHAREGDVQWRTGSLFALAGILPATLTAVLAADIPASVLTAAFAVVAAVAALRLLRAAPVTDAPRPVRPGRAVAAGAGLGAVTGFLGVGGGFLAVPAMVSVLGLRMRAAIGTSLLVITVNALAALAGRAGTADGPDWAVIAPFAGAAVLGAWDGRRLSGRLSGGLLRRIFACVLLAVAAFMLIDAAV